MVSRSENDLHTTSELSVCFCQWILFPLICNTLYKPWFSTASIHFESLLGGRFIFGDIRGMLIKWSINPIISPGRRVNTNMFHGPQQPSTVQATDFHSTDFHLRQKLECLLVWFRDRGGSLNFPTIPWKWISTIKNEYLTSWDKTCSINNWIYICPHLFFGEIDLAKMRIWNHSITHGTPIQWALEDYVPDVDSWP